MKKAPLGKRGAFFVGCFLADGWQPGRRHLAVGLFLFGHEKEGANGRMPFPKQTAVCQSRKSRAAHTNKLSTSSNANNPTLHRVNHRKYFGRISGCCLATSL